MAENLTIDLNTSKEELYRQIVSQVESLIESENNLIANLANICAVLDEIFNHLWTGFYLRDGNTLVLGPFQGPLACTRIPLEPIARGVCGAAAIEQKIQLVPNVDEFPGHIACSSKSKSEIVLPLIQDGETQLVLDIDSIYLSTFDETDSRYLQQIIELIKNKHFA